MVHEVHATSPKYDALSRQGNFFLYFLVASKCYRNSLQGCVTMVVPGGVFKQVQNCGDGKHEAYTLPTPAGAGHL